MKWLAYSILLIAVMSCSNKETVPPNLEELAKIRGLKDYYIGDFRCGVFIPPSYDPARDYPLILRLHGMGDTTSWNLDYYNEPIVDLDPVIVLTPKCPGNEGGGWGRSWEEDLSPALAKAYEMFDLVSEVFNIDTSRIYVCGSSMGGFGSFAAIRHTPDLFAAGYVECGGGDTGMAEIINRIPFWMFHGEVDDVVPVTFSRDMYRTVKQIGGEQLRYTEYEGVAHNVWDNTSNEGTISTWLMAQQKGSEHTAPSVQLNPQAVVEQGVVLLSWDVTHTFPVSDNAIWYVEIVKDGEFLAEVNCDKSSLPDSSIVAGKSYEYVLTGVNYFFIRGQSEKISVEAP